MTASRAERRLRRAALAIAGIAAPLVLGAAAGAQQPAGPLIIGPLRTEPGITVDRLGEVDPESIGVLTRETGSLDADLWRGADRAEVARLIAALPERATSPTVFALTRRLLLSTLDAPEGSRIAPSLAAERVLKLSAMGSLRGAAELARLLPDALREGAVEQAELEARLLTSDNAGACAVARAAVDRHLEPIWAQSIAYCRLLSGDADGAELAAGLARETAADDALFFALFDRLAGRALAGAPLPVVEADALAPLHLAMLRTAGAAPPVRGVPDHRLAEPVARSPSAPLALRIAAAERAAEHATMPGGVLRAIYSAATQAGEDGGSAAVAAFRELQTGDAGRRDALLVRAFEAARHRVGPVAAAELLAPDLARFEPRRARPVHVADAVRIALLAGDLDAAWIGREALLVRIGEDLRVGGELAALEPLLRIAGVHAGDDGPAVVWLAEEAADREDGRRQRRALLLLSLLDALGERLPPAAYGVLTEAARADAPERALAGRLTRLQAALDGRRPGEALLHALILLDGGRRLDDPRAASAALAALRRIGLDADARALALEAAIRADA